MKPFFAEEDDNPHSAFPAFLVLAIGIILLYGVAYFLFSHFSKTEPPPPATKKPNTGTFLYQHGHEPKKLTEWREKNKDLLPESPQINGVIFY